MWSFYFWLYTRADQNMKGAALLALFLVPSLLAWAALHWGHPAIFTILLLGSWAAIGMSMSYFRLVVLPKMLEKEK